MNTQKKINQIFSGIEQYFEENKSYYSKSSTLDSLNGILYSMLLGLEFNDFEYIENNFEKVTYLIKKFIKNVESFSISKKHSNNYLVLQILALYLQAISSHKNKNLITKVFSDESFISISKECCKEYKRNIYLKDLDFKNHWHDSNVIMAVFAISVCYNKICILDDEEIIKLFNSIEEKINYFQNPQSGLHISTVFKYRGLIQGIASTYHYLPIYKYLKKRLKYTSKIIESVKRISLKNGCFALPYGHVCVDLDSIICLEYSKSDLDKNLYLDIQTLLIKFIESMSKIQNTDGGFSIIGSKPKSFNFGLINLPYNMIKS